MLAIKILRSKLFFWFTVPVLIIGTIIPGYFSSIRDFPVFPNDQIFDYKFYSDSTAGGDSKILKKLITDSLIKLDYQISNKINSPYAGLNVGPKKSKSINLGLYNQLTIRLKGYEINGVGIALVTRNSLKKDDNKRQDILFYHIFKIPASCYKANTNIYLLFFNFHIILIHVLISCYFLGFLAISVVIVGCTVAFSTVFFFFFNLFGFLSPILISPPLTYYLYYPIF